jgi:two-component system C4-dicarboxylate transport response regulator DctD
VKTVSDEVLFVDDDDHLRAAHVQGLELAGLRASAFASATAALSAVSPEFAGVVVTDVRMPGMDGLELFERLRAIDPDLPVILITGHGDIGMAVEALKQGAYDFVAKPFPMERLVGAIRRGLEKRSLVLDNRRLERAAAAADDDLPLMGSTAVMERLRRTIRQVGEADVDVLIQGETGTGKGVIAKTLHRLSRRRTRPFVVVSCAALPEAVFETELFGQEAAAGGVRRRVGRIEQAERGTLFLDDVESLAPPLQAKLLSVIEERTFWPQGAAEPRHADIRIIAASKANLAEAVSQGAFRADLFYRLNVVTLTAPPLRERRDDALVLFARFLADAAARFRRPTPPLTEPVRRRLMDYGWPGNVRELAHYAERVALGLLNEAEAAGGGEEEAPGLAARVERYEAAVICEALAGCGGDARAAMSALQLPRKTFYDKLNRHGIRIDDYRRESQLRSS